VNHYITVFIKKLILISILKTVTQKNDAHLLDGRDNIYTGKKLKIEYKMQPLCLIMSSFSSVSLSRRLKSDRDASGYSKAKLKRDEVYFLIKKLSKIYPDLIPQRVNWNQYYDLEFQRQGYFSAF
jgi:hypothetical protein